MSTLNNPPTWKCRCGSGGWGIGCYRYICPDEGEQIGYGFYRTENPHDFFADIECCSPEEIAAHQTACAEWDKKQAAAKEKK